MSVIDQERELEAIYGIGFIMIKKLGFKLGEGLGKEKQGRTQTVPVDHPKLFMPEPIETVYNENSVLLPLLEAYETSKSKVIRLDQQIHQKTEKVRTIDGEISDTKTIISRMRSELETVQSIKSMLQTLDTQNIDSILSFFQSISTNYPEINSSLKLNKKYLVPISAPMFSFAFKNWQIEEHPLFLKDQITKFLEWIGDASAPLYNEWEISVMRYISVVWNPLDPSFLPWFIDQWSIPNLVRNKIHSLIVQRLQRELEKWSLGDLPLHIWIHPWLPLLNLSNLLAMVSKKISVMLTDWDPQDLTILPIVKPWKIAIQDFPKVIFRHVLPKLLYLLKEKTDLDTVKMVMEWAECVEQIHITDMLTNEFLPRWRSQFLEKLSSEDCDIDSISNWVSSWQEVIPSHIINFNDELYS